MTPLPMEVLNIRMRHAATWIRGHLCMSKKVLTKEKSIRSPKEKSFANENDLLCFYLIMCLLMFLLPTFHSQLEFLSFCEKNTTSQNVSKRPMQQMQPTAPRNSNLRELPIAPSHVIEMSSSRCSATPSAQVKPIISSSPPSRAVAASRSSQGKTEVKVKPASPVAQPKEEAKTEPEVGHFSY